MSEPYRVLTYEETSANHSPYDECYSVLVGPNGFECFLGEREDCTWTRDGRRAVAELNRLHSVNVDLLAACEAMLLKLNRSPVDKVSVAADMARAAIAKAKGAAP